MISRACLISFVFLLVSCTSSPLAMPAEVDGGWRLAPGQAGGLTAAISGPAPESAMSGVYEGPSKVTAHVLTFSSQAGAFETVQKSRPMPESIYFQEDRHFVLVQAPGAGNAALERFAKAFGAALRKAR